MSQAKRKFAIYALHNVGIKNVIYVSYYSSEEFHLECKHNAWACTLQTYALLRQSRSLTLRYSTNYTQSLATYKLTLETMLCCF